jgi:dolichol-phosphate mannosyltransferase
MKTAVIIPTFNEKVNLPILVEGILALDTPIDIYVVDDNSPDGTGEVADDLAKKNACVKVIHREKKAGLGTAYQAGFAKALPESDLIITMDADLSHDPAVIPDLIAKAEDGYDVVIGSRYVDGGSVDFGWSRRVLSRGGNFIATAALGFKTKDNTSGFRCYRREALTKILTKTIRSDGYSSLIELLYDARLDNLRIGETPIHYVDRQHGQTKVSRTEITKALQTVWRLRRGR